MSDQELFDEYLINQSPDVFSKIFKSLRPRLVGHCRYILGDRNLAEDIVQNIFIKFLLAKNFNHSNIGAYLWVAAKNACLNHIRDNKKELHSDIDVNDIACHAKSPMDVLINSEVKEVLSKAMKTLSPYNQNLFWLRAVDNIGYDELSVELNLLSGSLRTRFHRSTRKLKKQLEGKCL